MDKECTVTFDYPEDDKVTTLDYRIGFVQYKLKLEKFEFKAVDGDKDD